MSKSQSTSRRFKSWAIRPFSILLMICVFACSMMAVSANLMASPDSKSGNKASDRKPDDRKIAERKSGENKSGENRSDRTKASDRSSLRFSKFRLSPDELKKIVDLVEKDDVALANKLRRVMTIHARRAATTGANDRSPQAPAPGTAVKKPVPDLTPQQIAAAIEIFKDRDKELGKRMEAGLKENPERVKRMLSSQWGRIERMIAMKKYDPQLYKAQTREIQASYKMIGIAGKIRSAKPDTDTAKLRDELRRYVSDNLEARHQVRQLELKRLEDRVAKLKKQIAESEKKMDKSVEGRVKELLKGRSASNKSKSAKSGDE